MLIDSHAHLSAQQFDIDREEVIRRCREHGLFRIVEIGAVKGFGGNKTAERLADENDFIHFTIGLHPHDAKDFNETDWEILRQTGLKHPKVVGVGETGLDFFYNHSSPVEQREVFARHIVLARELRKPLVIHDRDAHKPVLDILDAEGGFQGPGVFHCFSGDWDMARRIIEKGWYIAINGIVTFGSAAETREVARQVPLESLLIETDCPYLAPVPHRGKRNEPWMVRQVAEKIADLRGEEVEKLIEETGKNALRLFHL